MSFIIIRSLSTVALSPLVSKALFTRPSPPSPTGRKFSETVRYRTGNIYNVFSGVHQGTGGRSRCALPSCRTLTHPKGRELFLINREYAFWDVLGRQTNMSFSIPLEFSGAVTQLTLPFNSHALSLSISNRRLLNAQKVRRSLWYL